MTKEKLTTELRVLRKQTGKKMLHMAEFFGTPYSTWRDWETGRTRTPKFALFAMKLLVQREYCEKHHSQG